MQPDNWQAIVTDQPVDGGKGYLPLIGKLLNLPPSELGTPFPPTDFVKQETAALNRLRVTLMAVPMTISDARIASPTSLP